MNEPKTAQQFNAPFVGQAEITPNRAFPLPSEINPNHPVTQEFRELWFKLCALLVARYGTETRITQDEIDQWIKKYPNHSIVIDTRSGGTDYLLLKIVTAEEARRLAQEEGGLPA